MDCVHAPATSSGAACVTPKSKGGLVKNSVAARTWQQALNSVRFAHCQLIALSAT